MQCPRLLLLGQIRENRVEVGMVNPELVHFWAGVHRTGTIPHHSSQEAVRFRSMLFLVPGSNLCKCNAEPWHRACMAYGGSMTAPYEEKFQTTI